MWEKILYNVKKKLNDVHWNQYYNRNQIHESTKES